MDVAVLGGGPAGTATALMLDRLGHSVIVIERSNYGTDRIGETLPPAIRPLLMRLGVWGQFLAQKHVPAPGIHAAWGQTKLHANHFMFNPHGNGWHLDRPRFDEMLAMALAENGVTVNRHTRPVSCQRRAPGDWELEIAAANHHRRVRASFVVDATGRAAWLSRREGAPRRTYDRMVGIIGFLSPPSPAAAIDNLTLLESVEDGWWYSALLPDGRVAVAFMTDIDIYANAPLKSTFYWDQQLQHSRHTKSRITAYMLRIPPQVVPANSSLLDQAAAIDWLAVGDAAATFDPLCSLGIYYALDSGQSAALAIGRHLKGDNTAINDYARTINERFMNYISLRLQFYAREQRWPSSLFWRRRSGLTESSSLE